MQHIQLTLDQIEERCTEQSFTRGLDYFDAEGNWQSCTSRFYPVCDLRGVNGGTVSRLCRIHADGGCRCLLFVPILLQKEIVNISCTPVDLPSRSGDDLLPGLLTRYTRVKT